VHTHGTGCSFASALATGLGTGLPVADAFTRAVRYVRAAIRHAPGLGAGHGPIGHALGTVPFDRLAPDA
ncbi:MAG TPA: bifunctional hydroxymethylpyrimidine kinase/phosphomethylpyrimidine kinase, partial [Sphingomonas sp.]|nr:bifunctional hydroxymethylpyrimidine kinase/phosphomethylpyrimidine kinase [Sphingomonas sp.]